jgi:serine/threonine protein kinase
MDLSKTPHNSSSEYASAHASDTPVFMFVCLWAYGGSSQPLDKAVLDQEPQIAELVGSVIRDGKGVLLDPPRPELFSALFNGASIAVGAAKALQQRFLSYQRQAEPRQLVPCVLISGVNDPASTGIGAEDGSLVSGHILGQENSARILICQSIYDRVKSVPGVQFNPKPVREPGQTGESEAVYELLWADESTYGHLREAAHSDLENVGRYQVQEELGRGAMGVVYKAHDPLIGRTVALKILTINENTPDREKVIERLKQEAKAAGKLDHPNIITIYDVGEEGNLVYLSMQFLEGKTLQTLLSESGAIPLPTLVSWADQICAGLAYAHSHGVIHRDLKPANIMLSTQGLIKVLDFGIAKLEDTTMTETGLVIGTPSHMAPEQVTGKKIDQRTDVFALGSVFYELVTHEKPFRGDVATVLYKIVNEDPVAPSLVNPAIPGGIDSIIRKALAKDPKDRFQTCDAMRKAFQHQAAVLNGKPVEAALPYSPAPESSPEPSPSSSSSSFRLFEAAAAPPPRSAWPTLVGVLALALLGGIAWSFYVRLQTGSFPAVVNGIMTKIGSLSAQAPDSRVSNQGAPAAASPGAQAGTKTETKAEAKTNPQPSGAASAAPVDAQPGPAPSGDGAVAAPQAEDTPSPNQAVADGASASPRTGDASAVDRAPSGATDGAAKVRNADAGDSPAGDADTKLRRVVSHRPQVVDGFTASDIPELLRQADAAEGRADYRVAIYSYNLILKLDPGNSTARSKLRRLQTAQAR